MSLRTIGDLLPELLGRYGLAERLAGWRAVQEWAEIVGERVAKHTRAISFEDGVILVEVEGSAWLHELGFLKPQLLRQLNRHLGARSVRGLKFVARGGIQR
jgi:predicted nucleic acid-binding Zn ribbon protein